MSMILYGINPVFEYLKHKPVGEIYINEEVQNQRINQIKEIAFEKSISITLLKKNDFLNKYGEYITQGVVCEGVRSDLFIMDEEEFYRNLAGLSQRETILLLDSIKDVGNLGSILRTALLFNVRYVIIPKNNAAMVNETVIKRSAGAVFQLKIIYVTNLSRCIEKIKQFEFWVYGASMDGIALDKVDYALRTAIVMGDEGEGIRRLVRENCDQLISIQTNDLLDSLNVSVSAGIILHDRYMKK